MFVNLYNYDNELQDTIEIQVLSKELTRFFARNKISISMHNMISHITLVASRNETILAQYTKPVNQTMAKAFESLGAAVVSKLNKIQIAQVA